jgi:competence protein ComGF
MEQEYSTWKLVSLLFIMIMIMGQLTIIRGFHYRLSRERVILERIAQSNFLVRSVVT